VCAQHAVEEPAIVALLQQREQCRDGVPDIGRDALDDRARRPRRAGSRSTWMLFAVGRKSS
jgi:hypothetical protein